MNIKIILILIILILLIGLILVKKQKNTKEESSNQLELTYEENASIPFKLEYEIENKDIVVFVKKDYIEDDSDEVLDGAPVKVNYIFKGLKKGKTIITFKSISLEDDKVSWEEKNYIIVDKNNNIFLERVE